jgi:ribosomal RNA-processing protein 8
MFSVPGWNVSAPLATQIEKPKPQDPSKQGKKAQKRKRQQEEQIDAGNVGEYWNRVVAGADTETGGGQAGEQAQEKRGKKRKRKTNRATNESKDVVQEDISKVQDTKAGAETQIAESANSDMTAQKDNSSQSDRKRRKKDQQPFQTQAPTELSKTLDTVSLLPEPKGLTPLQKSMRQKLASARFRHLNEALYTKPSTESLLLFKEDPSIFEDYHRGFAQQVDVWPENPVDSYVATILARGMVHSKDPRKEKKHKEGKRGKSTPEENDEEEQSMSTFSKGAVKPLPRNTKGHAIIADLGCGTASLSYRLQAHLKPLNITLHSFDLSKPTGPSAPLVTVADISTLPLADNCVDIAIFCLALMGTNWLDFIDEAYRVLRWRGEVWIAEIKSRFGRVDRRKEPPINSIGSLKKTGGKGKNKGNKSDGDRALKESEEGIQDSEDETELATRIDGVEAENGTDVSVFISILLKHGFVLDALPERQSDAIDLSNKMFVKLRFVKGAQPTVGKNAKKGAAGSEGGSAGYNKRAMAGFNAARGGLKMGIKGKKFTAIGTEDDEENDGKVLKPCLYKIR